MSDALRAIAEPCRRKILRLVWSDERAAGEIAAEFDTTFGAVSQHLRVLRDAGLVSVRRDGRRRLYRARTDEMGPIKEFLQSFWADRLDRLQSLAERRERASPTPRTPSPGTRNRR